MFVLGVSAFYHDSAAALVRNGEVIAAAQEERFSRKKHDPRFPGNAINYCLEQAQIEPSQLEAVVFYENPALTMDRVIQAVGAAGAGGVIPWVEGAPGMLGVKLFFERLVRKELGTNVRVLFSEHHLSHAASSFYPSPHDEAALLAIDGVGEWATTTLADGSPDGIRILKEIRFPHSLGLLYSAFTQYCGFKVNSGEYKLMGLAPYGKPLYADKIRDELIDLKPDGSYRLNIEYFGYVDSLSMTGTRFHDLFGGPPREPESRIGRREMDLAASIQLVTEEAVIGLARHLREISGRKALCMSGGVALNCVANGKLQREKVFDEIWIQPAAGDAGGALGAALAVSHLYYGCERPPLRGRPDRQQGSYLGPAFSEPEVKAFLELHDYPHERVDEETRAKLVAKDLSKGKIVGYMVGRSEFGPRSLGARSILGDARNAETQSIMNRKIKYRESFRPFAPSALEERSQDYFDLDCTSPYMLFVAPVQEAIRLPFEQGDGEDLLKIVNCPRSSVPAITHVDFSARVQTVSREVKADYHALINEFQKLTGEGVIVNTSFNVRGEPIVCSPEDAYRCFMRTDMDTLVVENFILRKTDQPAFSDTNWREEYELD
ncbi:MAG: carbamoyltransferase [Deltaproteobacteria bacterium]|nr:carbamoyltransferase [Deltaproteobacteria bacterium]